MARILVVDDNSDIRMALTGILQEAGHRVVEATDGSGAIDAVLSSDPSLIFLDAAMPGMDGFDTLRWLKSHPATRSIPVVMLTVLSRVEDRERARTLGAFDYITKPWEDGELELRAQWALAASKSPARRFISQPELSSLVA